MGHLRWMPARAGSRLLAIGVVLGASVPAQAQRWRTILPGTGSGDAWVVTHLPGGDPVVGGYTGKPATVARLASADGGVVWRRDVLGTAPSGGGILSAIAVDATGTNVYVGGRLRNADTSWDFAVARLAAADGAVVWRREIDGAATDPQSLPYFDQVRTLAVDTAGDVIAGGDLIDVGTDPAFTVVKLSGVDGSTVWETQLDTTLRGSARRVLVDAVGDVLVVGYTQVGSAYPYSGTLIAAKLDGVTGQLRWRYHAVGYGIDAAFAPDGNLLVVGYEVAAKLDPSKGTEVWRASFAGYVLLESNIAVDANGDVVMGGTVSVPPGGDIKMGLLKFSGADGAEIWRAGFPGVFGRVQGVGVDAAGDAFATGPARPEDDPAGPIDMAVAKIAGASGAFLWYRAFGVDDGIADTGERLAVDAAGDVVAVGQLYDGVDFFLGQFAVVKLNGIAAGDQPLPGNGLTLRAVASQPLKVTLKASHRLAAPLPVIPDADPMLGGATVEVMNPTTGEQAAIVLPAAGWLGLGTPPGAGGYRYVDSRRALGPCTKAELRPHRTRLQCQGDGIAFTLDEPSQGSIRVTIATGSDLLARCFEFAAPRKDVPGLFSARRAPAPPGCP